MIRVHNENRKDGGCISSNKLKRKTNSALIITNNKKSKPSKLVIGKITIKKKMDLLSNGLEKE